MIAREEKIARLKLIRSESIGPLKFFELLRRYETASKAVKAISNSSNSNILYSDQQISAECDAMKKIGARFVFWEDPLYPPMLREISDPPPVLSFLGNKEKTLAFYKKTIVSIVGARNASIHSLKFCSILAQDLSTRDVVIVSGLARGIDTAAHKASITNGTIAVLACGIDIPYPIENAHLYNEIIKSGAILSEMPIGTPPQAQLFPRRNRIIAGISCGTILVEAAEKSGSLITARMALEYGRDVFAVPGFPMDPRSIGGNKLIKDGAILVQSSQDVIDHINDKIMFRNDLYKVQHKIHPESMAKIKQMIINSLTTVPITIDELISSIRVSPREVLSALLELELANKIVRLHGQRICLALN